MTTPNVHPVLNVAMVQVNFQYGNNVFVPYAVGSIQAYAENIPVIKENFKFQHPFFLREDPTLVVKKMVNPSIVGISCYIWNWEYNNALAKEIRKNFPDCLIVFGGAHVPNNSEGFFENHDYVDILVHQEGEISFSQVLLEYLTDSPDYTKIPGLSVRVNEVKTHKTGPSNRIKDLSVLPSPYLSGVFDFMLGNGYSLNATQETNRGCPYQCVFCDWGGATYSKVSAFPESRILEEFNWFAENKVEYLFNGDANYGIWPRDLGLVKELISVREKNQGYPVSFRMCTAKKSNDRVFEIARLLNAAGMNKGATLSFQSMDDTTLELIKRKNIAVEDFSGFMDRYEKEGISTYTELIMGMPGETYESSKTGIDVLFNVQAIAINLYVHACTVLPNSEMGDPLYVKLHGIKSVRMPILLAHSTPDNGFDEFHNVIIGTKTMPYDDWIKTYMFYWAVQSLHCLGLLQHISVFVHNVFGVKYSDFYEGFVKYFSNKTDSLIGSEINKTKDVVVSATKGGRLDIVNQRFGNLYWPLEEMSFLVFVTDKDSFFDEVSLFLRSMVGSFFETSDIKLLDDLVRYQKLVVKDPFSDEKSAVFSYNLHDYFEGEVDKKQRPELIQAVLKVKDVDGFNGDVKRYAREVVWYGRRGGCFHVKEISVENV